MFTSNATSKGVSVKAKTHIELYQELVYLTLDQFISVGAPFTISIAKTNELAEMLPDFAFANQTLNIDFENWTLEVAFLKDNQLNCIVVYNETEYPLTFELLDILRISVKPLGLTVVNKFFLDPIVQVIIPEVVKVEKILQDVPDAAAIAKSTNGMRLLVPGEA